MAKKFKKTMKVLEPTVKEDKPNKPYSWDPRPDIQIKGEDLPSIETWDVGKEYEIALKVKMERYEEVLNSDTKQLEKRATLRIVAMGEYDEE